MPLPLTGRNLGRFPGPVRDLAYGCQDRREVLILSDQVGEVVAVMPADEYYRLLSTSIQGSCKCSSSRLSKAPA